METPPSRRFSAVRAMSGPLNRLTGIPYLATILALAGGALWFVITLKAVISLGGDAEVARHVEFAEEFFRLRQVYADYFGVDWVLRLKVLLPWLLPYWVLLGKCLLPALVVSLIRCRGARLTLPLTYLCAWVFLYWTGVDVHENLDNALNNPLGMRASPSSYFVKLALMGFLAMSLPLLMRLYHGSTLLDRYLARSFALPFLLCLGGISGIMITMDLLNHANEFVEAKFKLADVGVYYLTWLPQILTTITEVSLLLATLYALGRMSRYNELISMMTAGRGVVRVLAPVLIFGAWCALAVMALNYQLAPESEQEKETQLAEAKGVAKKVRSVEKRVEYNVSYRNRADRRTWLIHRMPYDQTETGNTEVWVFCQDEKGNPQRLIVAKRASWFPQGRFWVFYDTTMAEFDADGNKTGIRYIDRFSTWDLNWKETPGSILSERLNPEYLSVPELIAYLRTNSSLPARNLAKYEATRHWRFAMPFRCFLLVLLAAPLGIISSRRGLLGGVASAVGLFVGVYFLSSIALRAGEGLYVPPALGAWVVNGVFLIFGLYMLHRRSTNKPPLSWNPWRWIRPVQG